MGIGPISYREVMIYAAELELGPDTAEFLWEVIKRVDAKYLRLVSEKMKEEQEQARRRYGRRGQ